MRVFLTGANGWIGSAITRELLGAGHSVPSRAAGPAAPAISAGANKHYLVRWQA